MPARRLASVLVPLLVGMAVSWWFVASSLDRLPDELATHWDGSGDPNGFSSLGSFLTTTAAGAGAFFVLAAIVALAIGPRLRQLSGLATGGPGAVAGFFTVIVVLTMLANRDVAARDAELPLWQANLTVLGLLTGGVLGALLAGRNEFPQSEPARSDGRVVSTTIAWRGAWLLAGVLFLVGLVVAVITQLVILLLLAPVVLAFSQYHLTVGPGGVAASGVVFGWPRLHIPLSSIRSARSIDVRPFRQWGGWGLRARLDGSQGLVTRAGPGVEFTLDDQRVFVATVDDPARFVDAVDELLSGSVS